MDKNKTGQCISLAALLDLVPEEQTVRINYGELNITTTKDAAVCFISKETFEMTVINVEARDDILTVWIDV